MSAPKLRNNNYNKIVQGKNKTICKHMVFSADAHIKLDTMIANMEKSGYEYYDHIKVNPTESVIIFKLSR